MTPIPLADEGRLQDLMNDPATRARRWQSRANCTDLPTGDHPYFPDDGETPPVEAVVCCSACSVANECLATALLHEAEDGYRFGWWGGYSPDERTRIAHQLGVETRPDLDLDHPAELARELRDRNLTIPSIAVELGCTERTVYRYLARSAA